MEPHADEERWEAIEACERAFRATTLRVSTDNIGLARVKEGLELVRIGRALRPEMAAWRYGEQFGKRRRRFYLFILGVGATVAVTSNVGAIAGIVSGSTIYNALNAAHGAYGYFRDRRLINLQLRSGLQLRTRLADLRKSTVTPGPDGAWALAVPSAPLRRLQLRVGSERVHLAGDDALFVASRIMPQVNSTGAGARVVQRAVDQLQDAGSSDALFQRAADWARRSAKPGREARPGPRLSKFPRELRLAMEIAANEDVERRVLEGELRLLETAWRDAEEVAQIADDMFLPPDVGERLERLRKPG